MLDEEITQAQRLVRTDAYQMSIGEIVNMYESQELIVDPDFQRLFRWGISQKSSPEGASQRLLRPYRQRREGF